MQRQRNHNQKQHTQRALPGDDKLRVLLSDISLRILSTRAGAFVGTFAQAAGAALGADMLMISRVKSKNLPVETYALYDRSGETKSYSYSLAGTPCEVVYDQGRPLTINADVVSCFPLDTDLQDFGLHAYAGVPLIDEDGDCIGLIAALWVREHKDLRREMTALEYFAPLVVDEMLLLEAQERHDLAREGASSSAWYMDFEAGLEYFSKTAQRVVGQDNIPWRAKLGTALGALAPEDRRIVTAAFEAYRRGEAPFDVNFRYAPADGPACWLRMAGTARRNAQGRILAMAGDITDITELVDARRAAEAASRAKSDFLATMSHEIRTPMSGVLGIAGLLAEADIPEENRRQARVIQKSGEAMMVILNDVLDLSKIEAGKLELECRNFSPVELIEDVALLWRDTLENKGLRFGVDIDNGVPETVCGDDARLRQVLSNLLSNALKFTDSGTITLRLESREEDGVPMLQFSVSDTGMGMTRAQQKRLFSFFGQADKSIARRFGGTGLGLAISDQIVRMMGGYFEVESNPQSGSDFRFIIPAQLQMTAVKEEELEPEPESDWGRQPSGAGAPHAGDPDKAQEAACATDAVRRSILIAEDNEINHSVLQAFLVRLPLDMTFVENGAKAVELANARAFDVILMDVQMPVLDGVRATGQIRSGNGPCRNTPIIALTANAMEGDRQRYLDAGMTDYVSKPINPRALYTAIKAARPVCSDVSKSSARSA